MKLKTAIIILFIIVLVSVCFMLYLFNIMKPINSNNLQIQDNKPINVEEKMKEKFMPKEKKQQMIEFLEKPSEKTPAEQAEIKKKMMEFLEK